MPSDLDINESPNAAKDAFQPACTQLNYMYLLQVSLGMMGVLTEVTFQCEEWFNLRENITIRSLDWCLQNLHHLSTRSDHGKLWIEAHSEVCAVFDVWRTQQPVTLEQPGVSYWYIKV